MLCKNSQKRRKTSEQNILNTSKQSWPLKGSSRRSLKNQKTPVSLFCMRSSWVIFAFRLCNFFRSMPASAASVFWLTALPAATPKIKYDSFLQYWSLSLKIDANEFASRKIFRKAGRQILVSVNTYIPSRYTFKSSKQVYCDFFFSFDWEQSSEHFLFKI